METLERARSTQMARKWELFLIMPQTADLRSITVSTSMTQKLTHLWTTIWETTIFLFLFTGTRRRSDTLESRCRLRNQDRSKKKMQIIKAKKMIPSRKITKKMLSHPAESFSPFSILTKQVLGIKTNLFCVLQPSTYLHLKFHISMQCNAARRITSSKEPLFMISNASTTMTKLLKTLFSTSPSTSLLETLIRLTKVSKIFKIQPFGKRWQSCVSSARDWMLQKFALET